MKPKSKQHPFPHERRGKRIETEDPMCALEFHVCQASDERRLQSRVPRQDSRSRTATPFDERSLKSNNICVRRETGRRDARLPRIKRLLVCGIAPEPPAERTRVTFSLRVPSARLHPKSGFISLSLSHSSHHGRLEVRAN